MPTSEEMAMLWNYVIFSHQKITTIAQDKFFMPSVEDHHRFLSEMKITQGVVDLIEIATRKQLEVSFGMLFAMVGLQVLDLGKFYVADHLLIRNV